MFVISLHIVMIALGIMAILMLAAPLPARDERLRGYVFSRAMLSLSYIALGVYCYFKGRLAMELVHPIFLFMANVQAVLLSLSHINLIHPQRVTKRYVLLHFAPMAACLALYGITRLFCPHIVLTHYADLRESLLCPDVLVRVVWMAQYVALCVYFTIRFVRETQRWQTLAADFFADDKWINVKLIQTSFILIVCVGILTVAIPLSLLPVLSAILNIGVLVLYIAMGILFLQYPLLFIRIKPVLYVPAEEPKASRREDARWPTLRKRILSEKQYLKRGITLEQIALDCGVSRTTLSNALNKAEGMNFNAFINRLRIQEAQRLMQENPEMPLQKIAEHVGYTEQSNFSREFKRWSGRTPNEWKRGTEKN